MANQDELYVYFIYSEEQQKYLEDIEYKMCRKYVPGKVLVNGLWKKFTSIRYNDPDLPFSDAYVVAEGYERNMEYQEPKKI